jgi:predicted amidohydrolase YtcJ
MLDRNLFEIPPDEIRRAQVVLTIVGGRTVVERF